MKIHIHGIFEEPFDNSEVKEFEEEIIMEVPLSDKETAYFEIEEAIKKILDKIDLNQETYNEIIENGKKFENIETYKKERKKLINQIEEIEEYFREFKKIENPSNFQLEQLREAKKSYQELEVDLHYLEEEIKEIKKYENNEDYLLKLKKETKSLEAKYYEFMEERKKIIQKIQNEENKAEAIEFFIKNLTSQRAGYEISKSNEQVKKEYYHLFRRYELKKGGTNKYNVSFYTLEDFLGYFKVNFQDIKEAKAKENKLAKLRQKKRLEKSGFKKMAGGKKRKGGRVGGKSRRNLKEIKFERPEEFEKIQAEIKNFISLKNIQEKEIETELEEKLKKLPPEEKEKELKEYREKVKEEMFKLENEEISEILDNSKNNIIEVKKQEKELKEQEKKRKEKDKIEKQREQEERKREQEEKARRKAERETRRKQREQEQETVIEKITKPIKGFFNKIKSIFS
jgi:hypothetical protein